MSLTTRPLRPSCSVRGCGEPLERVERVWRCPRGHAFDVARSGYVNLLQPGDTRSRAAGDAREAVQARARLEERGLAEPLHAAFEELLGAREGPVGGALLDVGAGTGRLAARLARALGLEGWALDLSVPAVDAGARRHPELGWVVANADRRLPFADGAFAVVTSSTGPKHPGEFRRVLAPDGTLVVAVAASDDLVELRAAVLGEGRELDRTARTLADFEPHFRCVARATARHRHSLDRAALDDLLAATYRGARRRERERVPEGPLEVTLATDLLRFEPRTSGRSSEAR